MSRSLLILLIAVALMGLGQGQSLNAEDTLTARIYKDFVTDLLTWDKLAVQVAAQGKDNGGSLHYYKNQVNLTSAQEAALKAVVRQCDADLTALLTLRAQVVQQFKAQNPTSTTTPPDEIQQLSHLYTAYQQRVLDCAQQVHSAVGDAAFARLDQYLRKTIPQHFGTGTVVDKRQSGK